jgi:poly(3-hydroxybutyrate) depolymerase
MLPLVLALLLLVPLARLPAAAPGDEPPPAVLEGGLPGSRALVVALHGGSFDARPPADLARRLLTDLSSEARAAGLRLLVPVAPPEPPAAAGAPWVVPWLRPDGEALVWALVRRETAARRADPRRVHLAGQGAGATGALTLAARRPDLVAGVAAWSGTPEPLWDRERRVIGLAEPVVEGLRGVPVFLFSARDDRLLDRATLGLLVDGLRRQAEAGGAAELLVVEGEGGHGFGSGGPARGLRFLRERRKAATR